VNALTGLWRGTVSIRHHDVLTLARDPESGLLEGAHRIEVIDAWNLGQGLHRYLDLSDLLILELLFNYRKVLSDGIPDVFQSFWLRSALGPAPRQSGDGDAVAFVGFVNRNLVFHRTSEGSIAPLSEGRRTRSSYLKGAGKCTYRVREIPPRLDISLNRLIFPRQMAANPPVA
jgi:hypothetical protein